MMYNINVCQLNYIENGVRISTDAAWLLTMIQSKMCIPSFYNEMIRHEGKSYFWISHAVIIKELPMVFWSDELEQTKERRIKRLVAELTEAGLIIRHPNCVALKKSYYTLTDLSALLVQGKGVDVEGYKKGGVRGTKKGESNGVEGYKKGGEEYNQLEKNTNEKENDSPIPFSSKNAINKKPVFSGIEKGYLGISLPLAFQGKDLLIEKYNSFLFGKDDKGKIRSNRNPVALIGEINRIDRVMAETDEDSIIKTIQYGIEREWRSLNQEGLEKNARIFFKENSKKAHSQYADPNARSYNNNNW